MGVQGVFHGSLVDFPTLPSTTPNSQLSRRTSLLAPSIFPSTTTGTVAHFNPTAITPATANAPKEAIYQIHMMDGTRKSLFIYEHTTEKMLRHQVAEKLDLADCDYFGICESFKDGGEGRFGVTERVRRWRQWNLRCRRSFFAGKCCGVEAKCCA